MGIIVFAVVMWLAIYLIDRENERRSQVEADLRKKIEEMEKKLGK